MSTNFQVGQRVRVNSGEFYGQVGTFVGMDGSLYLVRVMGQTEHADSVIDPNSNNGD